jgi:hypothetical protein
MEKDSEKYLDFDSQGDCITTWPFQAIWLNRANFTY